MRFDTLRPGGNIRPWASIGMWYQRGVLLCPGPSIYRWRPTGGPIIGVNRAPWIIRDQGRVDWWVSGDIRAFLTCPLSYHPAVLTTGNTVIRIARELPDFITTHTIVLYEQLFRAYPPAGDGRQVDHDLWPDKSALAALVLAHWLGLEQLDVYGADWTDAPDADGYAGEYVRDAARWNQEVPAWMSLCRWMAEHGMRVIRHSQTAPTDPSS